MDPCPPSPASPARLDAEQLNLKELLKDNITAHQKESMSIFNIFLFVNLSISEVLQFSQIAT